MPLSEYKVPKEVVVFPGGTFEIRAISLPDVAALIDVHEYAITMIVDKVQNRKELLQKGIDEGNDEAVQTVVVDLMTELVREAPILVANLIALCADEPNQMENASKLPITAQIEALSKIAKLTFTDLASVKKLAADVMSIVRGILPTVSARPPKRKK
jgi:hypothetical protein